MDSKIGNSWLQLQLRGQQNAKSKIFGASGHTFKVERGDDGQSLLGFMKVVVPKYKELIPPPCPPISLLTSQSRISSKPEPLSASAAPRQLRQNTEATIALNAFSDLEAIAEMGAGTDDAESQVSEQGTRPSSIIAEHRPKSGAYPSQSHHSFATNYDQRPITESAEQQPQPRLGMDVIYRKQQPAKPFVSAGNMIQTDSHAALFPNTTDVFNFVPEQIQPSFDDPSSGSVSTPYHSPTSGIRRRGRGRKAFNMGDRQPSNSSIEHEGTPDSLSDFGPTKKQRGQRRPRKSKKPLNMPFDQGSLSHSPLQSNDTSPLMQPSSTVTNYISTHTEEDICSKLRTAYEMDFCESSSDDQEMDPPPPPKDLISDQNSIKKEMQEIIDKVEVGKQDQESSAMIQTGQKPSVTCDLTLSQSNDIITEEVTESRQRKEPSTFREIKLVSASPSSVTSSPSISHLMRDPSAGGDTKIPKAVKKSEAGISSKQQTENLTTKKAGDTSHNSAINTANAKKRAYSTQCKNSKDNTSHSKITTSKAVGNRDFKEVGKKNSAESIGNKRPAIVLKIKAPKEAGPALSAGSKHSSSSSPASSSSSSTISSTTNSLVTSGELQPQTHRLSGSAAPPSKYKQQQKQRTTKRPAEDQTTTTKKKCRKTGDGTTPGSPGSQQRPSTSSSVGSIKGTKGSNVMPQQTPKEQLPTSLMAQITGPFLSLKNFKIPKVVENADSTTIPSQSSHNKSLTEQGGHTGDKLSRNKEFGGSYNKPNDNFECRAAGTKQSGGKSSTYQQGDKDKYPVVGTSSGYQAQNQYNRQQRPQKQQTSRPANLEIPRKYSNTSTVGGGGGPNERPNLRLAGPIPSQRFSTSQQSISFPQQWQPLPPTAYQQSYQHSQQRNEWLMQQHTDRLPISGNNPLQHQPVQRTNLGQSWNQQRERGVTIEERTDHSPSIGSGLQIVDED